MRAARRRAAGLLAALILVGCGAGPTLGDRDGGVVPLAKAEGWRASIDYQEVTWALAEVADDRATAAQAWDDNLPADLPDRDGHPAEPGRYGSLDDVDFDRQAVVV